MKKHFSILIILSAALALTGCSKDDPVDGPNFGNTDPESEVVDNYYGEATMKPTQWSIWREQLSSEIYPLTNMTIVCDAQGIAEPSDDDLVSAFVVHECRGCATMQREADGSPRFYLTVSLTDDDPEDDLKVIFYYYSAQSNRIYQFGPVAFEPDGRWGSISTPHHFSWQLTNVQVQ